MWQNSAFMIKLAWKAKEKKVIVMSVMIALLTVALQVVNLYITPSLLSAIERQFSIVELLLTIVIFVGVIMLISAILAYVNENVLFGRITV